MYSETYLHYDIRSYLQRVPLCFGVWHGYKNCMLRMYQTFMAFIVPLERTEYLVDPENTIVIPKPDLVVIERMVAAMSLAAPDFLPLLERDIRTVDEVYNGVGVNERAGMRNQSSALHILLSEYVPVFFMMGYNIRSLQWRRHENWTRRSAKEILGLQILVLIALQRERSWG